MNAELKEQVRVAAYDANDVPAISSDERIRVYTSKEHVCHCIPITNRSLGLTVPILEDGKTVEYWFEKGIRDSDLVLKHNSSIGDEYIFDDDVFKVISPDQIKHKIYLNNPHIKFTENYIRYYSNDNLSDITIGATAPNGVAYIQAYKEKSVGNNRIIWSNTLNNEGIYFFKDDYSNNNSSKVNLNNYDITFSYFENINSTDKKESSISCYGMYLKTVTNNTDHIIFEADSNYFKVDTEDARIISDILINTNKQFTNITTDGTCLIKRIENGISENDVKSQLNIENTGIYIYHHVYTDASYINILQNYLNFAGKQFNLIDTTNIYSQIAYSSLSRYNLPSTLNRADYRDFLNISSSVQLAKNQALRLLGDNYSETWIEDGVLKVHKTSVQTGECYELGAWGANAYGAWMRLGVDSENSLQINYNEAILGDLDRGFRTNYNTSGSQKAVQMSANSNMSYLRMYDTVGAYSIGSIEIAINSSNNLGDIVIKNNGVGTLQLYKNNNNIQSEFYIADNATYSNINIRRRDTSNVTGDEELIQLNNDGIIIKTKRDDVQDDSKSILLLTNSHSIKVIKTKLQIGKDVSGTVNFQDIPECIYPLLYDLKYSNNENIANGGYWSGNIGQTDLRDIQRFTSIFGNDNKDYFEIKNNANERTFRFSETYSSGTSYRQNLFTLTPDGLVIEILKANGESTDIQAGIKLGRENIPVLYSRTEYKGIIANSGQIRGYDDNAQGSPTFEITPAKMFLHNSDNEEILIDSTGISFTDNNGNTISKTWQQLLS